MNALQPTEFGNLLAQKNVKKLSSKCCTTTRQYPLYRPNAGDVDPEDGGGFLGESFCDPFACADFSGANAAGSTLSLNNSEAVLPVSDLGRIISCKPNPRESNARQQWEFNTNPESRLERYDHELIKKTRFAIRKRQHAFQGIWENNNLLTADARFQSNSCFNPPIPCSMGISFKQWPPQLPQISDGLKIPIQLIGSEFEVSPEGVPLPLNFGLKAEPLAQAPEELFANIKGILNKPAATSCVVSPTSVLFLQAQIGQRYTATIKVQNKGSAPRKLGLIRPTNNYFDVTWGAELSGTTMIPPGLATKLIIEFRPKSDEAINDLMTIVIYGDGNIPLPIIATNVSPPILEIEEWDCGCSMIGQTRITSFEVRNYGGEGRFWLLTENEFNKEYLSVHQAKHGKRGSLSTRTGETKNNEDNDSDQAEEEEELITIAAPTRPRPSYKIQDQNLHPHPHRHHKKGRLNPFKMDHLLKKPFKLVPSCFRLQKNQRINIKTRYRPTTIGFHYEKIGILCDNGEVRWIVVKGVGIDVEKQPLVNLEGEWTGPPCDLPTDVGTKFTVDCGDLLPGEIGQPKIKLTNTSCIPLYFFWSIRPLHISESPFKIEDTDDGLTNSKDNLTMASFAEPSSFEWKDHYLTDQNSLEVAPMNIFVHPAQGILEGFQELEANLIVASPQIKLQYHSCVISLFVQQIEDNTIHALLQQRLVDLSRKHNDPESLINIPIFFTKVIKDMPSASSYDSPSENSDAEENSNEEKVNKRRYGRKQALLPVPLVVMKLGKKKHSKEFYLSQLKHPDDTRHYKKKDSISAPTGQLIHQRKSLPSEAERKVEEIKTGITKHPVEDVEGERANLDNSSPIETLLEVEPANETLMNLKPELKSGAKEEEELEGEESLEVSSSLNNPRASLANDFHPANGLEPSEAEVEEEETESGTTGERKDSIEERMAANLLKQCTDKCLIEKEKKWLQTDSFLTPTYEIEIWARSVPIQCWFDPPFFDAKGDALDQIERNFLCYNQTPHEILITWKDVLEEICSVTISPVEIIIASGESFEFKMVANLFNYGKFSQDLSGEIKLPFKTISCAIPINIDIQGASIEAVTPAIHFGLVAFGKEKIRTIGLTNTGNRKLTWRAKLSETDLVDGENHSMPLKQKQIQSKQLLKIWPKWGTLEPGETAGTQVYLYSDIIGKLATVIEVSVDHNPDLVLFIPVYAEIQIPYLILQNGLFELQNLFTSIPCDCSSVTLFNPTTFFVSFTWREPLGSDSQFCQITFEPQTGVVYPRGTISCQLTIISMKACPLNNLFVPCCVEGMKEPLLIQINGIVKGVCVEFILPETKRSLLRQDHISSMAAAKMKYLQKGQEEAQKRESRANREIEGESQEVQGEETGISFRPHRLFPEDGESESQEQQKAVEVETDLDLHADVLESGIVADEDSTKEHTKKSKKKGKRKTENNVKFNKTDKTENNANETTNEELTSETLTNNKRKSVRKSQVKRKSVKNHKISESETENVTSKETENSGEAAILEKTEIPGEFNQPWLPSMLKLLPEDYARPEYDSKLDSSPIPLLSPESKNAIYFEVNNLGKIVREVFIVKNNSPIPTKFSFNVKNFFIKSWIDPNKSFLQNVIERKLRSDSPSVIENRILEGNGGVAFEIYPKNGILQPYQMLKIAIHVHSNKWGIYEDDIICQIDGIPQPHVIHLEALITGCPNIFNNVPPIPIQTKEKQKNYGKTETG